MRVEQKKNDLNLDAGEHGRGGLKYNENPISFIQTTLTFALFHIYVTL